MMDSDDFKQWAEKCRDVVINTTSRPSGVVREDVEDACHECLLRVLSNKFQDQGKGVGGFCIWLKICVRRELSRMIRDKMLHGEKQKKDAAQFQKTTTKTPVDELLEAENQPIVRTALELLSNEHREILLLYYYEEQTISEIAITLDITTYQVGNRLDQARTRLGSLLKPYFELK